MIPQGVLWLAAVVVIDGRLLPLSASAVDFYYYAALLAGIALAWRFQSSRILFVLISLILAQRAVTFFSSAHIVTSGSGRIAFEAVSFLLPLNFLLATTARERGLTIPAIAPRALLLFVESVFVAVICRPGATTAPSFLKFSFVDPHLFRWTKLPQPALLAFVVTLLVLFARSMSKHRPMEGGLPWSLGATLLAFEKGTLGRVPEAYLGTAALLLASSLVEASYLLAYRDELTLLPARRAFNDALLRLQAPYAIAAVDIDHFKNFNDTYGHDVGDQVLRLVASRLAAVTGGGHAFRVGGEEFSILFPGQSMKEAEPHLELLRTAIQNSRFHLRGGQERRSSPRGPDRRATTRNQNKRPPTSRPSNRGLAVTVSIGLAEPTGQLKEVEAVIEAADKALYRAKRAGRNRVETAAARSKRTARLKRSIA